MGMPEKFRDRLELPVIAAPMFLVSGVELVKACCLEGVIGTFPALNARTSEAFESWVIEIKEELKKAKELHPEKKIAPFGVNLIVHKSNPRLEKDLEICAKHGVELVITSLGAASKVVETIHGYGGLVFHDVTIAKHARKAAQANVDGIIAVCAGAGGHAGTINPFALVDEIREFYDKTLILAGSISRGGHVLAAQAMGADMAYIGTRFIATQESQAQDEYKRMVVNSASVDIVHTPAVSGVPANFMLQSLVKNGFDPKSRGDVDFGEKLTLDEEAKAWKDVWSAGHGVGSIHDIPTSKSYIERLKDEYVKARAQLDK